MALWYKSGSSYESQKSGMLEMWRNGLSNRREVIPICLVRSGIVAKSTVQLENEMKKLLDLRGTIPPFTLLKLTHGFRMLRSGETMEVIGSNPNSKKEILNVLTALPCEVLYIGNTESNYFIRLRKIASSTLLKQGKKNDRRHSQITSPGCVDTVDQ
jgi:TusA-related sulfurtransferase